MSAEPEITIEPLTPARLDDFLAFFDGPAFADNPEWAACYCWFPYFDHGSGDFDARPTLDNRTAMAAAIRDGRARGYLAYAAGTVIGWANAAPRGRFPQLAATPGDNERTVATPCFTVDPAWRGQGVASQLLAAAIDGARAEGMASMEAAPLAAPSSPAEAYRGTVELYAEAGYEQVARLPTGQVLMKKDLDAD